MTLQKPYDFLEKIGVLPKLVSAALQYLGVREFPGKANNPVIMNMAKEIGAGKIYVNDSAQAWCAVFMFFILKITGKPFPSIGDDVYNLLRAKTFEGYGEPVSVDDIRLGDVVVFSRPDGFHVGIAIALSKNTVHNIGGNVGNKVSIAEMAKSRIVAVRRFYATVPPESAKRYLIDSSGKLSTNEA